MTTMGREDPDMQMLWSPMSREGHARYAALRHAIQRAYAPPAPPSTAQQLRAKYAAGARRSGDAMFFEAFGAPERLLRAFSDDQDDDEAMLYTELFSSSDSNSRNSSVQNPSVSAEPEAEPAASTRMSGLARPAHMSRLAKPTRLPTPKRSSLKRPRESSAEKEPAAARKPRFLLSDTTNIMHASTTTTTMTNPWDRHHHKPHQLAKPSVTVAATAAVVAQPFGASRFGAASQRYAAQPTATTSAFASTTNNAMDVTMSTSTRAFALR